MSGLANFLKQLGSKPTAPVSSIYDKVYTIAEKELGQKEVSGSQDNPRIQEYFTSTNYASPGQKVHDEVPWCAAFVGWVLGQAGLKGTRSAAASSYDKWGKKLEQPIKGCVVCVEHIDEHGKKTGRRHVALFSRLSSDPQFEYHLGGNQGNAVTLKKVDRREVNSYRSLE